jgi:hypothetical protein
MSKSVEIDIEKAPNIVSALSKLASSLLNQPKETKKESA